MSAASSRSLVVARIAATVVLIASLVFGAVGLVWGTLDLDVADETAVAFLLTPITGLVTATIVLVSCMALQHGRLVRLMWLTIFLAAVAMFYWLAYLWIGGMQEGAVHLRIAGTLSVVAVSLTLTGQLIAASTPWPALSMLRIAAAGWVQLVSCGALLLIWTTWWHRIDEAVAVTATLALGITLVGLLTLVTLFRVSNRQRAMAKESIPAKIALRLTCPRCAQEQELPTGLSRCASCGFVLLIEVEEPRCACGYLLYRIEGDTCPECGRELESSRSKSELGV